ncbi:MAG: SPOR domain-containing protein [Bacteroidales bacterium]|nr:SPOR domain-containing protein [Bacteroidales bacterium]
MFRVISLLLNALGVVLLGILGGVRLTMNTPSTVQAGAEFRVEVKLNKGDAEGFARFQQQLPLGLTAEVVEASKGNFSFEDQHVRFIWLSLPNDKEISLIYKIKVNERLMGSFNLKGAFSYISNNEKVTEELSARQISISPSASIDQNLLVDINEYQHIVPAQRPVTFLASAGAVRCIRQTPYPSGEGNDLAVNLLVSKGTLQKFAKIEEDIPQGFTAEAVDTREGVFTYKDNKAKILWMALPSDPRFVVSYRLIPDDGVGSATASIRGQFSYMQGEATQVIDIEQQNISLRNATATELDEIARAAAPAGRYADAEIISSAAGTGGRGIDIPVRYQDIPERQRRQQTSGQPAYNMQPYMLEPESGVYYRVQVAAGHRPINIKRYFERLNIDHEVRTERHEGWYKYSIGSFREYREARDFRIRIWNTSKANDAFVTAYNNGRRITVQEALMITNQQWYR